MGVRRLLVVLSILALCLPALALADGSPHGRTVVGTLTANPSGSVTVTSTTATLSCTVPERAIVSVAKLALGGRFKLSCRTDGGHLMLVSLERVGGHDHGNGDTSKQGDGATTGTTPPPTTPQPPTGSEHSGTTTTGDDHGGGTTTGTTPPPPPTTAPRTALGVVSFLSSTGVAVTPDGGGTPLTCAITPAPDSTAAAAKLKLGGRFGIVCRLDGTHYVLSGSTPLP